jgi:hypothetical protein|tara:strand:+ start:1161 stop:1388 length:228 start_codon:yes stop_codon:yes gene_type:complete
MPNISKVVVDVADVVEDVADVVEDVVEDVVDIVEDGAQFLMRPEVLACIALLIILICIIMYHMKRDDSVEGYKYR